MFNHFRLWHDENFIAIDFFFSSSFSLVICYCRNVTTIRYCRTMRKRLHKAWNNHRHHIVKLQWPHQIQSFQMQWFLRMQTKIKRLCHVAHKWFRFQLVMMMFVIKFRQPMMKMQRTEHHPMIILCHHHWRHVQFQMMNQHRRHHQQTIQMFRQLQHGNQIIEFNSPQKQ